MNLAAAFIAARSAWFRRKPDRVTSPVSHEIACADSKTHRVARGGPAVSGAAATAREDAAREALVRQIDRIFTTGDRWVLDVDAEDCANWAAKDPHRR